MMQPRVHHAHLAAVFPSWADARAALDELGEWGITDEYLGLLVHSEGDHGIVLPTEHEVRRTIGDSALAGVEVGALAGLVVLAIVLPGIGTVGVAGVLAASGGAAGIGALLGSLTGAALSHDDATEARSLESIPLGPGELLVYVRPPDGDTVHLWTNEKGEMTWGDIATEVSTMFERHRGVMVSVAH